MNKKIIVIAAILIFVFAGIAFIVLKQKTNSFPTDIIQSDNPPSVNIAPDNSNSINTPFPQNTNETSNRVNQTTFKTAPNISAPIDNPNDRITKKFFGTYVTPQNSPVSPEKFTGYHTGLDFETSASEKDSDVSIKAICTGKLLKKTTATGYGGYAIQSCTIDNQSVTVVYGHLRLSSINADIGTELTAGTKLGNLGTGFSIETDGERKHLHLSIHKGIAVNIKGYVQTKAELSGWIDPKMF